MFHLTTLVIANSLLRHFPKCISLVGPFLNFTFEFTQFHLWAIYSVPSSPNLFSFQLDEALSVRWCFMFLKITPLLAPYAADGPNTLHWSSWLNNSSCCLIPALYKKNTHLSFNVMIPEIKIQTPIVCV